MNATNPHWWLVNVGSGNGLVLSGSKPLPEPMLTTFHVAIWRHQASLCFNSSPLVPHICVNKRDQHWLKSWLVACSTPSHYLNQWWLVVNWTPGNKLQWNLNRKCIIFIQRKCIWKCRLPNWRPFCPGEEPASSRCKTPQNMICCYKVTCLSYNNSYDSWHRQHSRWHTFRSLGIAHKWSNVMRQRH